MELPSDSVIRDLVERYGRVLEKYRAEMGRRPLVLPNNKFFPDRFSGDPGSVQKLVDRMLEHAGMSDLLVEVDVPDASAPGGAHCGTGGCGSGGCAPKAAPLPGAMGLPRLVDEGDVFRIHVLEAELAQPIALTTELSRCLGEVFVRSVGDPDHIELPLEVTAELAAVGLGFGTLLLQGAHIYQKSCGGPSVTRLTALDLPELAAIVALFCRMNRHPLRRAAGDLEVTQRAALSEAGVWVDSNPRLVEALDRVPEFVGLGDFELEAPQSYLARLWSRFTARPAPAERRLSSRQVSVSDRPV